MPRWSLTLSLPNPHRRLRSTGLRPGKWRRSDEATVDRLAQDPCDPLRLRGDQTSPNGQALRELVGECETASDVTVRRLGEVLPSEGARRDEIEDEGVDLRSDRFQDVEREGRPAPGIPVSPSGVVEVLDVIADGLAELGDGRPLLSVEELNLHRAQNDSIGALS